MPTASVALEPQVLTLKQLLEHFIAHRKDVITRRTRYDLRKAEERAHLLEGYRIALDNIDEVIEIVRESQTTDEAKIKLSARFGLSDIQAQAIVDMRLRTLVGLERQKIEDEYAELLKTIAELQDILRSERRIAQIVKSETLDLKKKYGDERRTDVLPAEDEISMEQLVPNVEVVVTYTVGGYIKRVGDRHVPHAESRRPRRDRHLEPQERRRRAQLLRDQDARSRALLHEQGTRVSSARLRDSRIPRARRAARRSSTCSRCRRAKK